MNTFVIPKNFRSEGLVRSDRRDFLRLPWPPTVNHYWSHRGRIVYLGRRGREYIKSVAMAIVGDAKGRVDPLLTIRGFVSVRMVLLPPDLRRRDPDNFSKGVFDSLSKCGYWEDDCLIRRQSVTMGPKVKDGMAILVVEKLPSQAPWNYSECIDWLMSSD